MDDAEVNDMGDATPVKCRDLIDPGTKFGTTLDCETKAKDRVAETLTQRS